MKIYSQIKSQVEPLPSEPNQNRNSQFNFHQSIVHSSSDPPSQRSDSPLHKQKNKFSFKLQPQLYFQRNNPQRQKLYQAANHITVASSSSEKSQKKAVQRSKSSLSRKKIFDTSVRVTVLNEDLSNQNKKVQNEQQKFDKIAQQAPKIVQPETKPLMSILKRPIQPQPIPINNNSSFQYSREKSKYNIQKVRFVHDDTDKYITQPILEESISISPQPIKENEASINLPKKYPTNLLQKVEKNQQRLNELCEKLDRKITEDNQRNEYFMRLLSESNQKTHQKDLQIQNYERQISKLSRQRICQKQRINLQIQQSKRLQELIIQNRHLCAKVLQQSSKKPQNGTTPEEIQIQHRIKELQLMRQDLQKNRSLNQSEFLHLNNSTGRHPQLNSTIQQGRPLKQERSQTHVGNSALTIKQHAIQPENLPTFQMIPERGPPACVNPIQIKRVVLVSKIY